MSRFCRILLSRLHPSWCFYTGVVGIIIGTVVTLVTQKIVISGFCGLLGAVTVFLICLLASRKILLPIVLLSGMAIANIRIAPELYAREVFTNLVDQNVILVGTISEDPNVSGGNFKLRLDDLEMKFRGGEQIDLTGKIYVQLSTNTQLERSDRITLDGKLGSGFGIFYATLYRPKLIAVERAEHGDIFARAKHHFASAVKSVIPAPEVDLGLGYLVGEKSGLSEEFSEQLRAVGMTHVVVASGAHLGILIDFVRKMFGKISRFAGAAVAVFAIFAFAMIVGFTPSMTRAVLVALLGIVASYVGRSFLPLCLILLVAAVTLLLDPMNLLNLGWQLSFASFFAILVLVPRFSQLLYGGKPPPWLASMLITSIMASITCAPILIYNFGSISLLSLVANLVILPTLPYAMFLVLLSGFLGMIPNIGIFIARLAQLLLDLHIFVVEFLSEQKIFIMELPMADIRVFGIYLVLAIWLGLMFFRRKKLHKISP